MTDEKAAPVTSPVLCGAFAWPPIPAVAEDAAGVLASLAAVEVGSSVEVAAEVTLIALLVAFGAATEAVAVAKNLQRDQISFDTFVVRVTPTPMMLMTQKPRSIRGSPSTFPVRIFLRCQSRSSLRREQNRESGLN